MSPSNQPISRRGNGPQIIHPRLGASRIIISPGENRRKTSLTHGEKQTRSSASIEPSARHRALLPLLTSQPHAPRHTQHPHLYHPPPKQLNQERTNTHPLHSSSSSTFSKDLKYCRIMGPFNSQTVADGGGVETGTAEVTCSIRPVCPALPVLQVSLCCQRRKKPAELLALLNKKSSTERK